MFPWGAAAGENPEAIVVEVPETEAEPLDVLDDQVGAFGGGVGQPRPVPGQGGGVPWGDGPGEPFELGHTTAGAVVVEHGEASAGVKDVVGEVGLAQQF